MASQVTNYQCPACTGPLHYVGSSGKLACDYCGSQYEVAQIEAQYAQKEDQAEAAFTQAAQEQSQWDDGQVGGDWGADADRMRTYNCPSCGAELLCDATTAATHCPYCGNPSIVPGQFAGTLKPDLIIPFKLDKNAAVAALKKHYQGKPLLPKVFKSENHIQEVQGLYVPFWLYDAQAEAAGSFKATRSWSQEEGDYRVTYTDHFQAERSGDLTFTKIPADGSSKMDDSYMDSIEPFDYAELVPFSTAYLPGYLADRYDVSAKENAPRADARCRNSAAQFLQSDVTGYGTVIPEQVDVQLTRGQVHYALMPVWTLLTKWKGKDYLFMMNGQTGKLVGDLPISKGKFWGWFGGLLGGGTLVLTLLITLLFG